MIASLQDECLGDKYCPAVIDETINAHRLPRVAEWRARSLRRMSKKAARSMRVQVESVADHRGVETPRRLHLDGRTVEIVESDDQWPGTDYRYFKVKGGDGNVYILRLDEPSGEWEMTMFRKSQANT